LPRKRLFEGTVPDGMAQAQTHEQAWNAAKNCVYGAVVRLFDMDKDGMLGFHNEMALLVDDLLKKKAKHAGCAQSICIHVRGDGVQFTLLRKKADPAHEWVDGRPSVAEGETVTLLRVEGAFSLLRLASGAEGWVWSKYIRALHEPGIFSVAVDAGYRWKYALHIAKVIASHPGFSGQPGATPTALREAAEAGVFQDLTDVLLCWVEECTRNYFKLVLCCGFVPATEVWLREIFGAAALEIPGDQRKAQREVQKYRAMAPNFTALCVNVLGPQAARV
jgi:hypothetical protein